jgi:hypothetical protein
VWLVSASRLRWAVGHVRARHRSAEVVVFRVLVPRSALVRRRRGVWSSAAAVLPAQVVSVRPAAFALA